MKVGVIFCGFQMEEFVGKCLSAWGEIKTNPPDDVEFIYSFVSVPFEKFGVSEKIDQTAEFVRLSGVMNFHFSDNKPRPETEARGLCLEFLKSQNVDLIWMVDLDEEYSVENIRAIIEFVENDKKTAWWKLSLKNVIGGKFYLAEPFQPARIYRVNFPPYKLGNFRSDNNCDYLFHGNAEVPDLFLKSKTIPSETAWIFHDTWPNSERSKNKILYQNARWSSERAASIDGDGCSFRWDEQKQSVELNEKFFQKVKQKIPILATL